MRVNQLLPGNVAWVSPSALGIDQQGNVYLNTQAECVFSGLPRKPTQSVKVTMLDDEATIVIRITWSNAIPEVSFKDSVKVTGVKTR